MKRRQFLKLGSAVGVGALLHTACGESESPLRPDAQVSTIDGGGVCSTTEADALGPFFEEDAPMRTQIASPGEAGERLILKGTIVGPDCSTPRPGILVDI